MHVKRGSDPNDPRAFHSSQIPLLKKACAELCFLLDHDYPIKPSVTFIGNRYLFSNRQRMALMRVAASEHQIQKRKQKEVLDIKGKTLFVDGFNTIITLEIAYCHSLLLTGMDGTIRDLAGLHGTYRIIEETTQAIDCLYQTCQNHDVAGLHIYLDAPVSNSGRLKTKLLDMAQASPLDIEVDLVDDADHYLETKDNVVTSDAIILDRCNSWVNLVKACIEPLHPKIITIF